jgi:guanine nucleotide-binding protein subunit alpha
MGQCLSLDQEELKARAKSDSIDRQLQTWAKEEQPVIKILLLGTNTLLFPPFLAFFFF